MAQTPSLSPTLRGATPTTHALPQVVLLHLGGGFVLALALAAFVIGTAWDVQWHAAVGRDRVLSPPHVLMLAGIILAGLASLVMVLLDSWRARRGEGVDEQNSMLLFGRFRAPVGLAVSGFGALFAAIAFPLDDYWHELYGIDVSIWAPFHIMIISGLIMVGVGLTYLMASESNRLPEGRGKTVAQGGFVLGLALTIATGLLLAVPSSAGEGLMGQGATGVAIYPLILAFLIPLALLPAIFVVRRVGAASLVGLTLVLLRLLMMGFVPWAVTAGVAAEGLNMRPNPPVVAIVPFNFPFSILVVGLLLDALFWVMRRKNIASLWPLLAASVAGALLGTLLDRPWARIMPRMFYPGLDVAAVYLNSIPFLLMTALLGVAVALLLSRGLAAVRQ